MIKIYFQTSHYIFYQKLIHLNNKSMSQQQLNFERNLILCN